jgi:hypothetical protein
MKLKRGEGEEKFEKDLDSMDDEDFLEELDLEDLDD